VYDKDNSIDPSNLEGNGLDDIDNEQDFQEKYCELCTVCKTHKAYPAFCYTVLFLDDHKTFDEIIWPKLVEMEKWSIDDKDAEDTFQSTFCHKDVCRFYTPSIVSGTVQCSKLRDCMDCLEEQINDESFTNFNLEEEETEEDHLSYLDAEQEQFHENIHTDKEETKEMGKARCRKLPNSYYLNRFGCSKKDYYEYYASDYTDFGKDYRKHRQEKEIFQGTKPAEKKIEVFRNKSASWTKTLKDILEK